MKKFILSAAAALLCMACNNVKEMTVSVENPIEMDREGEMVEVSMDDVVKKIDLADTAQIVITDEMGEEVPCQITYDDKVIFPVKVGGKSVARYTIKAGNPHIVPTNTCGGFYPEREDDIAWENNLVAFRTYGPAFQNKGYKAYGYDVWTKYNTSEPVLEERYSAELNPAINAKIRLLRETNPEEAEKLYRTISYHVDHGNGMDCYTVGPTLGGGANAIMVNGNIVYPDCFRTEDILDNGPLRFTVQLSFNPLTVEGDTNVVERRVITLDSGSYLNKTVVSYSNLSKDQDVITGIVLHEADGDVTTDAEKGFIAYTDPTDNPEKDNGLLFIGAAFPEALKSAEVKLFSDDERNERGAYGHVIAVSDYQPGNTYTYYWGAAWSKAAIKSADEWKAYLSDYAIKVKNPLKVTVE